MHSPTFEESFKYLYDHKAEISAENDRFMNFKIDDDDFYVDFEIGELSMYRDLGMLNVLNSLNVCVVAPTPNEVAEKCNAIFPGFVKIITVIYDQMF